MVKELTNDSESVRLHAAIALGRIGDKACGAIEAIKACRKDTSGYVQRVTEYTLKRLADS
jgi:HEAT repeat protein